MHETTPAADGSTLRPFQLALGDRNPEGFTLESRAEQLIRIWFALWCADGMAPRAFVDALEHFGMLALAHFQLYRAAGDWREFYAHATSLDLMTAGARQLRGTTGPQTEGAVCKAFRALDGSLEPMAFCYDRELGQNIHELLKQWLADGMAPVDYPHWLSYTANSLTYRYSIHNIVQGSGGGLTLAEFLEKLWDPDTSKASSANAETRHSTAAKVLQDKE